MINRVLFPSRGAEWQSEKAYRVGRGSKRTILYCFGFTCQLIKGGYSSGVHLFPFRTEKLSPDAPMVLSAMTGE